MKPIDLLSNYFLGKKIVSIRGQKFGNNIIIEYVHLEPKYTDCSLDKTMIIFDVKSVANNREYHFSVEADFNDEIIVE